MPTEKLCQSLLGGAARRLRALTTLTSAAVGVGGGGPAMSDPAETPTASTESAAVGTTATAGPTDELAAPAGGAEEELAAPRVQKSVCYAGCGLKPQTASIRGLV